MYSESVWKPGDFLKAHSSLRKHPVNETLTIKYDDYTYYLLRIIRATTKHCRSTLHFTVVACVDVMGSGLSLVESFDPSVMHVVNTIFNISVSNSWMFTYHDQWNSHGKIVNSFCPFMVARRVYLTTVYALNLLLLRQCEYYPQCRRSLEHLLTQLMSVIISFGVNFDAVMWTWTSQMRRVTIYIKALRYVLLCMLPRLISDVQVHITAPKLTFNS